MTTQHLLLFVAAFLLLVAVNAFALVHLLKAERTREDLK